MAVEKALVNRVVHHLDAVIRNGQQLFDFAIHVLQQIVHGQNIRTTEPARNPEQVRNVNQVALQAPHDRPEVEIPFQRVIAAGQSHRVKVRRQRATFRHFGRRSNEEVLAVEVQARQRADHIPDVGAHPEFRHATDVDGYFHEWNLTTGDTEANREFAKTLVIPSEAREPYMPETVCWE